MYAKDIEKDNDFVDVIKAFELGVVGRKPRLRLTCKQSGTYMQSKNIPNKQDLHPKSTRKKCVCSLEIHRIKLITDGEWV